MCVRLECLVMLEKFLGRKIKVLLFLAGIISLLDEPLSDLKVFALKKLDTIVDEFWPEISEAVEKM